MNRTTCIKIAAFGSTSFAVLALNVARADVTVQERIAVEGTGLMSMANMSGTSTTSISGQRSRIDSDLQMESRLVRMFARGVGQSTDIVRLDDDKVYELNMKKKQYKESSLTERRAQLAQAAEQARQAQEKQPAPTGLDESQCEWSDPQVDVNKTGAQATIAGFDAQQVTVVAKQSCKDRKTGAVCDIALSLDEWVAPGFVLGEEVTKFNMAYAQQMGLTNSGRDVTERAEALFGRYKGAWSKVADKMRDIKGYPVKTSFAFGVGGQQCQGDPNAGGANQSANSGGTSATHTPGGIAGQIAGSLFGRKRKQQEAASPEAVTPAPAAMNGMVVPLRVSSELVSISKDPLSASTFEVPAGFKKVSE
jgi:hypothetical protein